jgi:hypothetical protein
LEPVDDIQGFRGTKKLAVPLNFGERAGI